MCSAATTHRMDTANQRLVDDLMEAIDKVRKHTAVTSQPASQPASQRASQPASQRASEPAS
jgi:hypothetical protein